MEVIITIGVDNAAFDLRAGTEVVRILESVLPNIEHYTREDFRDYSTTLRDYNGNMVGSIRVLGDLGE